MDKHFQSNMVYMTPNTFFPILFTFKCLSDKESKMVICFSISIGFHISPDDMKKKDKPL